MCSSMFSKKVFLRSLLLGLLLLPTAEVFARRLPAELEGGCELFFLLNARSELPEVFSKGAEYDVDLFSFANRNLVFFNYLKTQPLYNTLLANKPPLVELEIKVELPDNGRKNSGPEEVYEDTRHRLVEDATGLLDSWGTSINPPKLLADLKKVLQQSSQGPSGLLVGMTMMLDKNDKKSVLKEKNWRNAITRLEELQVDQAKLSEGFDFKAHGINTATWQELVSELRDRFKKQEALAAFVVAMVHQENPDAVAKIKEWLKDTQNFYLKLSESSAVAGLSGEEKTDLFQRLEVFLKIKVKKAESKSYETIYLVEQPDWLSSLRGLIGGDCASDYCFAFGYLPAERTFYLKNEKNEHLGYAGISELNAAMHGAQQYSPARYLHDITGAHLSKRVMEIAIHAIAKWGLEETSKSDLFLPTAKRIYENNNHADLIATQQNLIKGTSPAHLQYPDAALRDNLSASNVNVDTRYDTSSVNQTAHPVNLDQDLLRRITVKVKTRSKTELGLKMPELTKDLATVLVLDILTAERDQEAVESLTREVAEIAAGGISTNGVKFNARQSAAAQVAQKMGLNINDVLDLNHALRNNNHQTLELYYQSIEQCLAAISNTLRLEELRKNHSYLFFEGHLKASDRITTDNAAFRKNTVDYAVQMIRRWSKSNLALQTIAEGRELFETSERFKNLISYLINGPEEHYPKLRDIQNQGIDFSFLDDEDARKLEGLWR